MTVGDHSERGARQDYRTLRPRAASAVRLDIDDQVETAMQPAELRLIECDAGQPLGV